MYIFWYIILRDKILQGSTQFSLYKSHSKEPKKDKKNLKLDLSWFFWLGCSCMRFFLFWYI